MPELVACGACQHRISPNALSCPNCGEPQSPPGWTEATYYAQRSQIEHELKQKTLEWIKIRFWVVSAIFAAVGLLGIEWAATQAVGKRLSEAERLLLEASVQVSSAERLATEALGKVRAIQETAQDSLATSSKTAEILDKAKKDVATAIADATDKQREFANRLGEEAERKRQFDTLAAQFSKMDTLVNQMVEESKSKDEAVAEARQALERIRNDISRKDEERSVNVGYSVAISGGAPRLVEITTATLVQEGFKTSYKSIPLPSASLPFAGEVTIFGTGAGILSVRDKDNLEAADRIATVLKPVLGQEILPIFQMEEALMGEDLIVHLGQDPAEKDWGFIQHFIAKGKPGGAAAQVTPGGAEGTSPDEPGRNGD